MAALVLAEHDNSSLDEATAKTVTAAAQIFFWTNLLSAFSFLAAVVQRFLPNAFHPRLGAPNGATRL